MSRQIQFRRGTATEHENFIGAMGEITVDTTNKTLRVHDGVTAGGTALARQSDVSTLLTQITNLRTEINNLKQSVVASVMPNWDAVVAQEINTEYTATSNGYLLIYYDDYNGISKITINNNTYVVSSINGVPAGASSGSLCVPIVAGDTYKYLPARALGTTETYIKFIPCQG